MFRIERLNMSTKLIVATLVCASLALAMHLSGNAEQVSQNVSWLSWLMGQSGSFEFHFLDLLELLSR